MTTATPIEAGEVARRPGRSATGARLAVTVDQWWPALPLLVVIAALLLAPAILLIGQSLSTADGLGLGNWERIFSVAANRNAVVTTLALAAASATLTTLIGGPLAWLIHGMLPASRAGWMALLNVSANFGGIGLAFSFFATIGTQGMITRALQATGMDFDPPRGASFLGLLLAYEYTNIPLFVLLTLPAMGALRPEWFEAAEVASASRLQFWRRVGIPVLGPFLLGGWLLIFTWSIGIYSLAFGLAGNVAASSINIVTLQIGNILQTDVFGRGRAAALAVVLMVIATLSLLAYRVILRRAMRWL